MIVLPQAVAATGRSLVETWEPLEPSEAFNLVVLDALPEQIAVLNQTCVIVAANEAWRQFGRDNGARESAVGPGMNYVRVCEQAVGGPHAEDGLASSAGIRAVLERRLGAFQMEYPCHAPGREQRWFNMSVFPLGGVSPGVVVSHRNITERKLAERRLVEGHESLRASALHTQAILDNMADGVVTIDALGMVESFNKAASTMFGYAPEEVLGRRADMLITAAHRGEYEGYLRACRSQKESNAAPPREVQGQRSGGGVFPMSLAVSRLDCDGRTTFVALVRDITRLRRDEEEIRHLALHDSLTGLPNRRLLIDRLEQAVLNAARTGQHGAVMFLDLDYFKPLNDSLGHEAGDELLHQVALRLQACVRATDSVARLDGDEFVVLVEALSVHANEAAAQTEVVANKILEAFGRPYALRDRLCSSTPSIGIVMFMDDHDPVDQLLKKADVAMCQAKAAGRNTVRFLDRDMQAAAMAYVALGKDIRQGLARNEFVLHYQIQVDGNGAPTSAEALVRWDSPLRGMVSPAQFIPLAEESGFILPLGQWVLETACAQLVEWSRNADRAHWTMAVNVSASQLSQADFVTNVVAALRKTGADPRLLMLELTESMLVDDVEGVIAKMNEIKARGVCFALDDFGTGYSSLSYLKRLPLDQLKIDESFVRHLMTDPSDAVIARAIVGLGHSLGLKVMAEGVETSGQRDFLAQLGCDAYQGYLFGRPLPANNLPSQRATVRHVN
jgi:diguanylate cyclase (GGDEF)-like protein/PAS domain S-box-containing protein